MYAGGRRPYTVQVNPTRADMYMNTLQPDDNSSMYSCDPLARCVQLVLTHAYRKSYALFFTLLSAPFLLINFATIFINIGVYAIDLTRFVFFLCFQSTYYFCIRLYIIYVYEYNYCFFLLSISLLFLIR